MISEIFHIHSIVIFNCSSSIDDDDTADNDDDENDDSADDNNDVDENDDCTDDNNDNDGYDNDNFLFRKLFQLQPGSDNEFGFYEIFYIFQGNTTTKDHMYLKTTSCTMLH